MWWIATIALVIVAYLFGKRDRWLEPHCYCRGDKPGHACLTECWQRKRSQHGLSKAFAQHMRRPAWLRRLHTTR